MSCHIGRMASVNMRQLRDTKRLKALLRAGTIVELRERDQVIARIIPEKLDAGTVKYPDFAARRKKMFGDRVFSGADLLIQERGRY
jgi:antitoxin (DNA-binding transcriptional repressor) of toxin-antitoxin stability system